MLVVAVLMRLASLPLLFHGALGCAGAGVWLPIDGSLPATERLERPYFDVCRMDWRDATDEPGGIEFNLPISSWIRLFHRIGFEITDYTKIQAPESATGTKGTVTADWAKRFPSEQVWRLKNGRASVIAAFASASRRSQCIVRRIHRPDLELQRRRWRDVTSAPIW